MCLTELSITNNAICMTICDGQTGSTTGGQIAQLIGSLEHLKLDIQGHVLNPGPVRHDISRPLIFCAVPTPGTDRITRSCRGSRSSRATVFEGEDHLSGEEVTVMRFEYRHQIVQLSEHLRRGSRVEIQGAHLRFPVWSVIIYPIPLLNTNH